MELKQVGLFLLDLDGTFYWGNRLIPGAKEFLEVCRKRKIPFAFLTNNSSRSAVDYIDKLHNLGIHIGTNEIFTSGDATIWWMQEHDYPRDILLIGTGSLMTSFQKAGFVMDEKHPQAVVLGFDTDITYNKLRVLCDVVNLGIPYIATHPDYTCPVDGGSIPDVGSMIAYVKAATGRVPDKIIGKPNNVLAQMISSKLHIDMKKFCMIGDRLYTDIAFGKDKFNTILVLSGETKTKDLIGSSVQPDMVFQSIKEIVDHIR